MNSPRITNYWKRIINTMNDGLMLIGPEGNVMMVNQAFERLTDYTAEEIIGRHCTILECDACEKVIQNDGKTRCALFQPGQKDIKKCRCLIRKKDGGWVSALKNASVLRDDDDQPVGVVETISDLSELHKLEEEVNRLTRKIDYGEGFHGIIGKSPAMQKVFSLLQKSAQSDAPVIIYGESGTGKELAAQAIHELGPRREAPFIQFNCAALNESLIESELFGHAKGSFTGAYQHHIGRFEAAHGGDIFLDEIGDVPASIQVKLLRVLEARQIERVGDHSPIAVDVRLIMATNRNLEALVSEKKFREDLFFRINVIPIHLPPLRVRKEDIPLLVSAFIEMLRTKTGKMISRLSQAAMQRVMAYGWPGNVRELKSALDYAFIVTEGQVIQPEDLPANIQSAVISGEKVFRPTGTGPVDENGWIARGSGGAPREPEEKTALIEALRQTGGNQTRAAKLLGINRVTVWNRMRKYGINLEKELKV